MTTNNLVNSAYFWGFMMSQGSKYWDTSFTYNTRSDELYITKVLKEDAWSAMRSAFDEEVFDKNNFPGENEFFLFLYDNFINQRGKDIKKLYKIILRIYILMENEDEATQFGFHFTFNNQNYKFNYFVNCDLNFILKNKKGQEKNLLIKIDMSKMDMRTRIIFSSMLRYYLQKYFDDSTNNIEMTKSAALFQKALQTKYAYGGKSILNFPREFLPPFLVKILLQENGYKDLIVIEHIGLKEASIMEENVISFFVLCFSYTHLGKNNSSMWPKFFVNFYRDPSGKVWMKPDQDMIAAFKGSHIIFDNGFDPQNGIRKFMEDGFETFERRKKKTLEVETKEKIIQLMTDFLNNFS